MPISSPWQMPLRLPASSLHSLYRYGAIQGIKAIGRT